jgi:hypothetical protein
VPWANEKSTSSWKRPWTTGRSSLLPTQPASGYRSAFTRDPFWALPLPGTSAPRRDLDRPRRDSPSTPPIPRRLPPRRNREPNAHPVPLVGDSGRPVMGRVPLPALHC